MDTQTAPGTQIPLIAAPAQTGPAGAAAAGAGTAEAPSPSRFGTLLAAFRERFEARLCGWLAARRRAAEAELPEELELVDAVADLAAAGGKRLRPALIHFTHLACGGRAVDAAIELGLAVELLHTYLLVHDDVMDHAAVRRGRPAAHVRFAALHRERGWHGDGDDFGRSLAILAGDLAHSWAVELFAGADAGARRGELDRTFAAMSSEVVGGQLLELRLAARRGGSADELLRALRLKSGRYSVERPIELGALLAGAPAAVRAALGRYGRALGEAFQLQDDVLGLFGDSEAVGKPVGGDLAEGKYTFLVHHALANLDADAAARVRAALGRPDLAPEEAAAAVDSIRDSGALERVREMIAERLEAACAELAGVAIELEALAGDVDGTSDGAVDGRDFLAGLIDGMGRRRR